MVSRAIDRPNNNLISEVFLYIKDEIDIPSKQTPVVRKYRFLSTDVIIDARITGV